MKGRGDNRLDGYEYIVVIITKAIGDGGRGGEVEGLIIAAAVVVIITRGESGF